MAAIVLFDLDGTVLTFDGAPPGPGRASMDRMMLEIYGVDDASRGVRFAGGTDRAIVRALLGSVGVGDDHFAVHWDRAIASYLRHLADELARRKYRPIGDVALAVNECARGGACVGLATGNVREGARMKLASAGLAGVFTARRSGFGCDAEERTEIVRAAIGRCGGAFDATVVVVGDTRNDVAAGRAVGARVVGVAVDDAARAELEEAGADAIVDACNDALVSAIFGLCD